MRIGSETLESTKIRLNSQAKWKILEKSIERKTEL